MADDGSQRDAAWHVIGGGDRGNVAGAMNRAPYMDASRSASVGIVLGQG